MINRREVIRSWIALTSFFLINKYNLVASEPENPILKMIPSSSEKIPSVGMGTWLTFDVGYNTKKIKQRASILKIFFNAGGTVIDTSPMYGSSEYVLGKCLNLLSKSKKEVFSATKIWTPNSWYGKKQYQNSKSLLGLKSINLLQVHNLVNYSKHLEYMTELKTQGHIKYIGVTTSHGRRHNELINVMKTYDIDFIQMTYNILDTECENYILPLAKEKGIAVMANRPFQGGNLFSYVKNVDIPKWLKEVGINSWAELFIKFTISNPSVTCSIPATSNEKHMVENMKSMYGNLLSEKLRLRSRRFILDL